MRTSVLQRRGMRKTCANQPPNVREAGCYGRWMVIDPVVVEVPR
jgi:hypothetical protein